MNRKALAAFMTSVGGLSSMAGCGVSTGSNDSKEDKTTDTVSENNADNSEGAESEDATTDEGEDVAKGSDESMKDREEINLWFWGAEPYVQYAMKKNLVVEYNASQDKYQLVVEFRQSVDSDMTTALAANQGPDIVYGSGPAFVMPLVEAGKLEEIDTKAELNDWKVRILKQ